MESALVRARTRLTKRRRRHPFAWGQCRYKTADRQSDSSERYVIEQAERLATDDTSVSWNAATAFFQGSPDGILLLDPVSSLPLDFNDAACRQLGYDREEFGCLRICDYEARETPAETQTHIDAILGMGDPTSRRNIVARRGSP